MTDRTPYGNLFLSAGAMKTGTTWLYSNLAAHPDLVFSREKETHFLHRRYMGSGPVRHLSYLRYVNRRILRRTQLAKGHEPAGLPEILRVNLHWMAALALPGLRDGWYRSLFPPRTDQQYACDFSNRYALLPAEAWPEIAARSRRLRVLYTMRHPTQRIWSHVRFNLRLRGVQAEARDWPAERLVALAQRPEILEQSEYGAAIRRMRAGLPAESLRVQFFEDVHADPLQTYRDIEAFLGIRHHPVPAARLARRHNPSPGLPMPAAFADAFRADAGRIVSELHDLGLSPPPGWVAK